MTPGPITSAALRYRGPVLACLACLLVVAALGITRLHFDFSSQAFYAADPKQAAAVEELQRRWGPDDARLFVVVTAADGSSVVTAAKLRELAALAQRLRAVEGVRDAHGIAEIVPPDAPWAAKVLHATAVVPLLLSEDDRATVIVVELERTSDDVAAVSPIVAALDSALGQTQNGLVFELAGLPVVRAAFHALAISDQQRLQPIVYVVVAILLAFGLRTIHGVVVPLLGAGLTIVLLVGAMGWAGEPIGLLNQSYFTLLPVIAAADAVHWVARFHEELRALPDPRDRAGRMAAVERSGRTVGHACLWTAATTVAGFASLLFADMPILQAFGLWAAIGVVIAFAIDIAIVPILLTFTRAAAPPVPRASRVTSRIATVATLHPYWVIGVVALVGVSAAVIGARAEVDNRLGDLLDADHPARRASELVDTRLGGTLSLEIELAGEPGTFERAQVLEAVAQIERVVAEEPEVRALVGPIALAAAPASVRAEVVDATASHARVRAFVADTGGRAFESFARRVEAALPEIPGVRATVTGTVRMAYAGVNRITTDLRASLVGLLAVVTLVLMALARSVLLGLFALPVNALPLVVGTAVIAAGGGPLDPLATVVLAVGLGLAVDDTIHLILRAREHGGPPREAFAHAVATSGRAVVLTSLALAAGLGVNLISSFPPLRTLGLLGAVTILAALLADIVLMPALVSAFARGARRDPVLPSAAGRGT